MTIHDRHDFQAFSSLCRANVGTSSLRHRKGRVDEAFFFVQHAARTKLVGDVRSKLVAESRFGTKSGTGDARFCNSDNTAAACAIAPPCSESTTPLRGFFALERASDQGVLQKYSLPESDAEFAPNPNRSAESSYIYSSCMISRNFEIGSSLDPRLALNVQKGCAPYMMLFDHPNEG